MLSNLRTALSHERYTARFMADYLGISEKSVSNKLQGKTEFNLSEYQKLCKLLPKYSASWLFYDAEKGEVG